MSSVRSFVLVTSSVVILALILTSELVIAARPAISVPITVDRHRIHVPVRVNGSRLFQLILDTGMHFDGIYLFHREFAKDIDTAGAIEVKVPGAGGGEPSKAVMIETGQLTFGEVVVDSQRVIISGSHHTQDFPSDGVIGWNLFGHYIVEIDYDEQLIRLHDSSYIPVESNWTTVPITLKNNIPWLETTVEVIEGQPLAMQMYIDLASEDVLELLTGPNQKFTSPDNLERSYLGTGLSGDIFGHKGKSHSLAVGGHELSNLPTAFAPSDVRSKQDGADGILGNGCIERFNVIFDYYHQRMYVRPNKSWEKPFD